MLKNIPYLYLKRKELQVMLKANILAYRHGVKTIDKLNFQKYKKSDTMFILGSGSSVNKFTNKHWDIISDNDSLGLNFWIAHDFIPTFYCYEEPADILDRRRIFYDIMDHKKKLLLNTPIVIKDLIPYKVSFERIPQELKKNIYLSLDFDLPVKGSQNLMMNYFDLLKKMKRFENTGKIKFIYSVTASLSYAAFFALLMGYKKIVFCGVDLSNSLYFYEENRKYYEDKGMLVPKSSQEAGVHSTNVRTKIKIPISEVLKTMYETIFKANGVEFYVSDKSSGIYKDYKVFFSF